LLLASSSTFPPLVILNELIFYPLGQSFISTELSRTWFSDIFFPLFFRRSQHLFWLARKVGSRTVFVSRPDAPPNRGPFVLPAFGFLFSFTPPLSAASFRAPVFADLFPPPLCQLPCDSPVSGPIYTNTPTQSSEPFYFLAFFVLGGLDTFPPLFSFPMFFPRLASFSIRTFSLYFFVTPTPSSAVVPFH